MLCQAAKRPRFVYQIIVLSMSEELEFPCTIVYNTEKWLNCMAIHYEKRKPALFGNTEEEKMFVGRRARKRGQ